MKITKTSLIQISYVIGQCISIGAAFAGSIFAIYDYRYQNQSTPELISDYLWIFTFASLAAAMGGFTAYKFQGIKINAPGIDDGKPHIRYKYDYAPRNWKSNLSESIYLIFTCAFALVYNYFLVTAVDAMYDSLDDPTHNYPTVPLNTVTTFVLLFKTIVVDLPFDLTNADYEACEEIKEDITGSKAGPLISLLVKPLASKLLYKPTISWLKSAGTLSHVLTDFLGLLLSIPSGLIIKLYTNHPKIFWALMSLGIFIAVPLLFVNYVQALYFESKISEVSLKSIKQKADKLEQHPFLTEGRHEPSFLRTLLQWRPILKKPIYYGLYTQGVIRGGGDVMPVVLFLRSFFQRQGWSLTAETVIIIPIAIFVFMSSTIGTHYSEVTVAMQHYEKDFQDIDSDGAEYLSYGFNRPI